MSAIRGMQGLWAIGSGIRRPVAARLSTACSHAWRPTASASNTWASRKNNVWLQSRGPQFCHNHQISTSTNLNVHVQEPAPDFRGTAVVDGQFKEMKLEDYKGKYVVLFFYPLDFTFVCPTEIISFSDRAAEFKAINTEVIGVSIDSHFSHLAWIQTPRKQGGLGQMNIPLLSDMKKQIAEDYGVLLRESGIALRGLFIIDPEGIVRHMSVNDLPVGRSVDETLRLVKAFQFVEEHGEVCPAGWTPDSETIKPDPTGSREYFERVN